MVELRKPIGYLLSQGLVSRIRSVKEAWGKDVSVRESNGGGCLDLGHRQQRWIRPSLQEVDKNSSFGEAIHLRSEADGLLVAYSEVCRTAR